MGDYQSLSRDDPVRNAESKGDVQNVVDELGKNRDEMNGRVRRLKVKVNEKEVENVKGCKCSEDWRKSSGNIWKETIMSVKYWKQ